jgi:hypothetical protein
MNSVHTYFSGLEIWTLTAENSKNLKTLCEHFKNHVQPKLNPVFAHYKFSNEVQGTATFDQFVTKLKLLSKDCAYTDTDEMIRDRSVRCFIIPDQREADQRGQGPDSRQGY